MAKKTKNKFIKLFRENGFNCFPIPNNQKQADYRYKSSHTIQNQPIKQEENYGVIPMLEKGNCIVDFDDKERYRHIAEKFINKGYMVIETGRGWHLPVIGLTGNIQKIELFDYNISNDKIIEIQGPKHYCVGAGSIVLHDKLEDYVTYENKGTDKILDAKGKDFVDFVDALCLDCKVESKKANRSRTQYLRERFSKKLIPNRGQSNDYFFEAARVCYDEELTEEEALDRIKVIYDKWVNSENYSGRPWSNIEQKVRDVYENPRPIRSGRPNTADEDNINRAEIARTILKASGRRIYSNKETDEVFENKVGYLEKINKTLRVELYQQHEELTKADQDDILFKLISGAKDIPKTNKDLIWFKNGVRSMNTKEVVESDELADMGFKDFEYLNKSKKNEPKKWLEIMFSNVPKSEHPRIKAGLRAIMLNKVDPKMSIIVGKSGVGKTTGVSILANVLGDYALTVELDQLLEDKFIKAKIVGKRLLNVDDIPKVWKKWSTIKSMTRTSNKTERGFMQDAETGFSNKIKIWASGNYLPQIPEDEKDAMFTRGFSLIHNIRQEAYPEDMSYPDKVAEEEGEKIISWIFNLTEKECKYEDKETLEKEWTDVATPEISYLEEKYESSQGTQEVDVKLRNLWQKYEKDTHRKIKFDLFKKRVIDQGYTVKNNTVTDIQEKKVKQGGITA